MQKYGLNFRPNGISSLSEQKFNLFAISSCVSISTSDERAISKNLFFSITERRAAPSARFEGTEMAALLI